MKKFRLIAAVLACVAFAFSLTACGDNKGQNMENNLLTDASFQNGFGVMGIQNGIEGVPEENIINNSDYTVYNVLDYGGKAEGKFAWRLAQWGTKEENSFGSKENYTFTEQAKGQYLYTNAGKTVAVDTSAGSITLAVHAGAEYDAPRVDGQLWPHLLIEQVFSETGKSVNLSDISEFRMRFRAKINECLNLMGDSYVSARHAAQITWYLTLNSKKPGVRDFIWIGVPLYDNRSDGVLGGGNVFFDNGLSSGTGMLIYTLPGNAYLKKGVTVGEEVSVNVDLLPYFKAAIMEAQSRGLFPGYTLGDFTVGSTNFGWEVPGTFDCSVTLSELGLIAVE
ncbi:MAG: hypothetical protein IJF71_05760 [Clostridia bacterium]|nr:hypothetical protein [Clostridia bacterium]